jgi:hypothetical protein
LWCAIVISLCVFSFCAMAGAQDSGQSSSSKHTKSSTARLVPEIDGGTVVNGVYRNRALALTCKIPAGWVLRTEEMNARDEKGETEDTAPDKTPHFSQNQGEVGHPQPSQQDKRAGKVLLAAYSRPPDAKGEEVNASIMIAAESVENYPGMKEAAQYFYPLTEVAKAQGFEPDEDPYAMAQGSKTLVRGDFHKDVGSRVMHQSTLVFLARGYAVSITVIGGTDDEVEDLVDGVSFSGK